MVSAKKLKTGESFVSGVLEHLPAMPTTNAENVYANDFGRKPLEVDRSKPLVFQVLELEEGIDDEGHGLVHVFGASEDGCPLMLIIHTFKHYFYYPRPEGFKIEDLDPLREYLNGHFPDEGNVIGGIEIHRKSVQWATNKQEFLKIILESHSMVRRARDVIKFGRCDYRGLFKEPKLTYESDVPYLTRFMLDTKVVPFAWVEIDANKYEVVEETARKSTCLEFSASSEDVKVIERQNRLTLTMAPLRFLSFDIETMVGEPVRQWDGKYKRPFPKAETEPVLQIGCTVSRRTSIRSLEGTTEPPFLRCVFALDKCADIPGARVYWFSDEKTLLKEWSRFVREIDPDVVLGFNSLKFDLPYLLQRARILGLTDFGKLGRFKEGTITYLQDERPRSWQDVPYFVGRLNVDVFHCAFRKNCPGPDGKFTLQSISERFLGDGKEGVTADMIPDLQKGDPNTRKTLAIYCMKDTYLAQQLCDKLDSIHYYMEMVRKHHVPFVWLTVRENTSQVTNRLREAGERYIVEDPSSHPYLYSPMYTQ
ncbi:ribonuclease H-like domain-containing protein [Ephemerocybe angulata]|uniref:DNA polymerase delta catalytic subunit n=1 Tax=Ephemerocybe angulata TaxID=980116 RepID=A0A8H6HZ43_9AGAR|nr:ribonuclease H-like domain-containing protein [Tulosesus angulatus]